MRDELKEKIECNECGLPVEVCNICVFASMSSHLETEKERASLADEYRADIIAYTEKERIAARIAELQKIHDDFYDPLIGQGSAAYEAISKAEERLHELKKGIK